MNQIAGASKPGFFESFYRIFKPLEFLEECKSRYGDTFTVSQADGSTVVYISNPDDIRDLFATDPNYFSGNRENEIIRSLLGEKSLMSLEGEEHLAKRKLIKPAFHEKTISDYQDIIVNVTEEVISQWPSENYFSIRDSIQKISLEIILRAVFGLQDNSRLSELRNLLLSLLESNNKPLLSVIFLLFPVLRKDFGPLSPGRIYIDLMNKIDKFIYEEIDSRNYSQNSERTDILQLMIASRDEDGQRMTNKELRDQLMTLLVAGHETTATSISWAMYWIHHKPIVYRKLQDELLVGNTKNIYLKAICKETLRIYPAFITTLPRVVKLPSFQLGKYTFSQGTILAPCIYLAHRNEMTFPDSGSFIPERFIEKTYSPYEYLPFGGGHRLCIGMSLALLEMEVVLETILRRYKLNLADNNEVYPVRRGVTIAPPSTVRYRVAKS